MKDTARLLRETQKVSDWLAKLLCLLLTGWGNPQSPSEAASKRHQRANGAALGSRANKLKTQGDAGMAARTVILVGE